MDTAGKDAPMATQFFGIRLSSVTPSVPLAFDLFLLVNDKPVHFRKRGDVLTLDRMKLLARHGGDRFLVLEDQRPEYLASLKNVIGDPDSPTEMKSKFIKESAFLHVHDLFTKAEIGEVVNEAKSVVEEMVTFVTTDVEAVASLMRLSAHDYYTYNHCVDVAVYSIVLARKILGDEKRILMAAGLGGLLHDIGKKRIAWDIINKSGKLTAEEWAEIKMHPLYGKEALEELGVLSPDAKLVVFEHHENFDGTGYPRGLSGDEISKLSRVVTIADVFDALTTDRSYHRALPAKEALNKMFGMQPGKFDPELFKTFNKNFEGRAPMTLPADFDPCSAHSVATALGKK